MFNKLRYRSNGNDLKVERAQVFLPGDTAPSYIDLAMDSRPGDRIVDDRRLLDDVGFMGLVRIHHGSLT